jgi:putative ABC transport system ATP-binding protein
MELIKTENLNKTYQDNGVPVEALKNINLTINKGEYVVIAGPSGSGKTTLLNLLGALDEPTSGKVLFENEDRV